MPIDMKAVILAAGQGSRLRPAKPGVPKCLLEVGGKTLIEHQLAVIDAQGIRDVVAVVGYKNELIKRHKPVFNVRLRDDKQYLTLRLDERESWPRITQR